VKVKVRTLLKAELMPRQGKRIKPPPSCLFCGQRATLECEIIGLGTFKVCSLERCVQVKEKPLGWSIMQRYLKASGARRLKEVAFA
jgi:hypothetical protein